MSALQAQSGAGLLLLCALAWAMGGFRRDASTRVLIAGLLAMLGLAAALLHIPALRAGFALIGRAVDALARATQSGTALVFGYLGGGPLPFAEATPGSSFILFFQALPLVLLVWNDKFMLLGTPLGLSLIATLSAWWPAHRASRLGIVDALRHV